MAEAVRCAAAVLALCIAPGALAGNADVLDAQARCDARRLCEFTVTVRHADTGRDHYANAWIVRTPDGTVLATRRLLHPHVDEQPFTRSLSGVTVPAGIRTVIIEATDSIHGAAGARFHLDLD